MTAALASGFLLGLSCGLAPGPLMALVLAQSLRYGTREGCKVACVPLLSDLPVIFVAFLFAAQVAHSEKILGALSIAGGIFILYLAIENFRPPRVNTEEAAKPKSLFKGTMINLLSPNPWLFWLTIGATTLAQAIKESWYAATTFLVLFYGLLIGSKALLAVIAGRSRELLNGRAYRVIMQALGVTLVVFALMLFWQGFKRLC